MAVKYKVDNESATTRKTDVSGRKKGSIGIGAIAGAVGAATTGIKGKTAGSGSGAIAGAVNAAATGIKGGTAGNGNGAIAGAVGAAATGTKGIEPPPPATYIETETVGPQESTPAPTYDRTVPNVFEQERTQGTQKPKALPTFAYEGGRPQFQYDGSDPVFENPGEDAQLHQQYQDAMAALEAMKGKAPVYGSQYDAQIQDLYNQIMNRGAFKYDSKTDPLYQQYVQDYTQQGKMAMRDTMGQAAALTGGYGSTYAQSVGQQQYDQYLQRMADILPQTYGMALDAYNAQGNEMRQNLAMTQDLEQSDYARYLDALQQHNLDVDREQANVDNWYNRMVAGDERLYNRAVDEYNRLLNAEQTAYERGLNAYEIARQQEAEEYQRAQDEYARLLNENEVLYGRAATEENTAYNRQMDQYDIQRDAYTRLMQLMAAGYTPTKEDYNAAGLSEAQGEALHSQFIPSEEPEPQYVYTGANSTNEKLNGTGSAFESLLDEYLNGGDAGGKKGSLKGGHTRKKSGGT